MGHSGKVHTIIENGIAKIRFFHPKSNSLPGELLRELSNRITDVSLIPEIRVIVLESEGEKSFCAGASFDELISIKNFFEGKKFFSGFAKVINTMRKSGKLIIARVQGKAVGGGVGLIAAADYALAVDTAEIKLSELALGLGPFVVGPAVERKIGVAAFSEMSIDYEWRSASWAKEKGLYVNIYSSISELDEAVKNLSEKLASANPEATKELKRIFWQDVQNWDILLEQRAELSGRLVLSEFTKNYIEKFKEIIK